MKHLSHLTLATGGVLLAAGCATIDAPEGSEYGTMPDGETITAYTLTNANGMEAEIINYGGTMTRLLVPDRDGELADVLLAFDNLEDQVSDSPYFNAIIGRYGNRIANGEFELDGETYNLPTNDTPGDMPASLHGGEMGFDKVVWTATPVAKGKSQGLKLEYTSADGEQGYPGTLEVTVHYWLTDDNVLRIEYEATTDKPTVVNLTQHNYYNLAGEGAETINDHELQILAETFTPVNPGLIPTGELRPVEGTPFDFTELTEIGSRLDVENQQLEYGMGYDHNWVLDKDYGVFGKAAELYHPDSGRVMEVWTEEPGLQFYGGNFLDGTLVGKSGEAYPYRSGLCLETQHYPDAPNQPDFPSTTLRPGETYKTVTEYRFSTR